MTNDILHNMVTMQALQNEIKELRNEVDDLRARMHASDAYQLSAGEREQVNIGLAEARAGAFVSDNDVNTLLTGHGLKR